MSGRDQKYVEANPDNETYFGIGYAEWIFDENGPKKEMLDEICADKPMMILGSSAHEAWVNSKALELAGITKDTPDRSRDSTIPQRRRWRTDRTSAGDEHRKHDNGKNKFL